jgi:hypothetical protein
MPPVSTTRIVAQYFMMLIGTIVAVITLFWVLAAWFQIRPANSAMGIIVIYVAAAAAGSFWSGREAEPASGRRWRVATICALLTSALQGTFMGLLLWAGVALDRYRLDRNDLPLVAGVMAGFLVLEVLLIRLGLWQGIRQGVRAARLRAERAARR